MNKVVTRLLAFAFSLIFLFQAIPYSVTVRADSNIEMSSDEELNRVKELIGAIGSLRANAMLEECVDGYAVASADETSQTEVLIQTLEAELFSIGVEEYTTEELLEEFGDQFSPDAYLPPSTSSVNWYMYGYNHVYEGVPYKVRLLFAQGLSAASNLAGGADSRPMYSSPWEFVVSTVTELGNIYVQKLLGDVASTSKVVGWTPYELLFSAGETITDFQHYVTYRYVITVCFSYVYPLSEDESAEQMTFVSSSVAVSCSHTFAGFENGVPRTFEAYQDDYTVNAANYASKDWSCKAYKYPATDSSSFVSHLSIYNKDGTRKVYVSLATPNAWSLIY